VTVSALNSELAQVTSPLSLSIMMDKSQSIRLSVATIGFTYQENSSNIETVFSRQEDMKMMGENSYPKSWKRAVVAFPLRLGTFQMALDVNIIGVAIPHITTGFNSLDDVSWLASAYLLTITALQPTMGFIYKSFDIRLVYSTNILILEGQFSVLRVVLPSKSSTYMASVQRDLLYIGLY
jgi:hypothetical protein